MAIAGFAAYGSKGLPAERVAEAACRELMAHHRSSAPADPHLADQLVLPLAWAAAADLAISDSHPVESGITPKTAAKTMSRVTTSKVSHHLLTNVWVVEQFLARELDIEGKLGTPGTLVVTNSAVHKVSFRERRAL
jgi:RNA 3'-terminal phosphate cyclase (ATP)